MVHVDGLVARVLELAVDLLALERLRLLLRDSDEDDPVADATLSSYLVGDLILTLFVVELIHRNLLPLRHRLHRLAELLGDLSQHHR